MKDATELARPGIPPCRGAEWVHDYLRDSKAQLGAETHPTATTPAYVNHGRWVVDCPDCNNAQLACRTDHRFLCNECGNIVVGGLWRVVVWPTKADAIEQTLSSRPLANQNWNPGQTITDLKAEQVIHGKGL